jgi:hypothetical protein
MNGITAITAADIVNRPVRTIRSADPFHTPESAELKRGFVYGLLEPETRRLRYIGSTTRTLAHRDDALWQLAVLLSVYW